MKKELPPPLENALRALLREHYGIAARQLRQLPGELDLNVYVASTEGGAYLLKISHEGEDEACLHMQVAALRHLAQHAPELQLSRVIPTRSGAFLQEVEVQGRQRLMRLLSWVPGRLWARVSPHTPALLQSLGEVCGRLSAALQHFEHPAAHRSLRWDPARAQWVAPYLEAFEQPAQRDCARYCWQLFQQQALPLLPRLPASINHNDANDYNILVNEARGYEARVTGLIDFGDMVYTRRVNELAIACAYACMHKPDPLQAALPIVAGYHRHMPLNEDELAALWPLMATRLLISVTASLLNRRQHPDNAYLQISEAPAWALMEKIRHIPPALAHYSFRQVCGLPPCPQRSAFDRWIARHRPSWGPVLDPQVLQAGLHLFDLSVGSTELGNVADFDKARGMQRRLQAVLEEADAGAGIGAYGEARPFYSTDNYREMGNEGPRWRTVHLGVDVFLPPGTAVRAPYPGRVHSFANRAAERDYGPVVILEHELEDGLKVFSLYGHLSRESLRGLQTGMTVERGQQIGKLGNIDENGGWPPHLHFQLMLDMLGMEGDFPGAAFPGQREVFCSICPDPSGLLVPQPLPQPAPQPDVATLLRKRQQLLGRSLSLSYHQPLYIRRGYLQHLYAADGRRYLDTVNNVPHLGHQHPRVVSAARRQMAVLNTNTRYLHETILEYAQTLLARVPQPLSVVHFVNSGSEANELALRMAQAYSGQQDMLVLETGYHGNTNACIAISSYKFDGKG
ncbi:MAG: aminotransferase class III-fold pyridoxal phosphate-dependent enzyme, partial [Bacteroidetes bacterium]